MGVCADQLTAWPASKNLKFSALVVEPHYVDGLYVTVWIEQLHVPTEDSRIIQYDYRPLVDDAVHTQEVLRQTTLPGTFTCSQDGCKSCMAAIRCGCCVMGRSGDVCTTRIFKHKHVADKARQLATLI